MPNLANNGFSKSYALTGWIDNATAANPMPNALITGSRAVFAGKLQVSSFNSEQLISDFCYHET